jgi:hypothetical protein
MNRRFRVLRIHGPYPIVHGFITGLLKGRGLTGRLFYFDNEKIEADFGGDEGLAERLAEWIGFQKYLSTGVVLEEALHGPVLEGLKSAAEELHLEVEASRAVKEAGFEVRFRTFSEEEGTGIRNLVENPPEGVRIVSEPKLEVERHDEGIGIEAYAPEHSYKLEGSAAYAGPIDRIVEYRRRMKENPLIHCGPIRLELE